MLLTPHWTASQEKEPRRASPPCVKLYVRSAFDRMHRVSPTATDCTLDCRPRKGVSPGEPRALYCCACDLCLIVYSISEPYNCYYCCITTCWIVGQTIPRRQSRVHSATTVYTIRVDRIHQPTTSHNDGGCQ